MLNASVPLPDGLTRDLLGSVATLAPDFTAPLVRLYRDYASTSAASTGRLEANVTLGGSSSSSKDDESSRACGTACGPA